MSQILVKSTAEGKSKQLLIVTVGICRGAMNNNVLCLCCRHGLLAYVYTGVSVLVSVLVAGKWLLYTTAQWP